MSAWTIAISNVATPASSFTPDLPKPKAGYRADRCLYCGTALPARRTKYCDNACMRRHHNFKRPKTRDGRKAKK